MVGQRSSAEAGQKSATMDFRGSVCGGGESLVRVKLMYLPFCTPVLRYALLDGSTHRWSSF